MEKTSLENAVKLPAEVAIFVPGTLGPDAENPKLAAAMETRIASAMAELFGGCTVTDGRGWWISETCGPVAEAVRIVSSNTTEAELVRNADKIMELAAAVKTEMQQEAVSVRINGALYLV